MILTNSPVPPSREEQLQILVKRIKMFSASAYTQISNIQNDGIGMLWEDNEFTPQEIINALGEDVLKVFQYHGMLTDCIIAIATLDGVTPSIKTPTNSFTVSGNTITVLDQPYA